jgi:hypothetical protein
MLVYLGFPAFIAGISLLILGAGWSSAIRFGAVTQMVKNLMNLSFLNNYMAIYEQLEGFGTTVSQKGGVQNFAEIARHYLFIVYLVGIIESLIKAIFPLYIFPLLWGLWGSRKRDSTFVLFLAVCYFLMLYFLHVKMDSIRERFMLALVFLLCPWIGVGFEQLFSLMKKSPKRVLITAVCLLFLGFLPLYKSVEIVWKQDDVFVKAGKWIAEIPELKGASLVTNDTRISFYAGRSGTSYADVGYDDATMEKIALARRADLLVIKRSSRKKNLSHQLGAFREVKQFVGKKNIVDIYFSPELENAVNPVETN